VAAAIATCASAAAAFLRVRAVAPLTQRARVARRPPHLPAALFTTLCAPLTVASSAASRSFFYSEAPRSVLSRQLQSRRRRLPPSWCMPRRLRRRFPRRAQTVAPPATRSCGGRRAAARGRASVNHATTKCGLMGKVHSRDGVMPQWPSATFQKLRPMCLCPSTPYFAHDVRRSSHPPISQKRVFTQ